MDSLILVDGGLVANIPVKVAAKAGGDFVIAVNTTSGLHPEDELGLPWIVADQIVSIPMKLLNEEQLNEAGIVIKPQLKDKGANDFTDIDSVIKAGYESALASIKTIRNKLDSIFNKNMENDRKEFYVKNIILDNNIPASPYLSLIKLAYRDSISNYEVIKAISRLVETGDYKDVKAKIVDYGNRSELHFMIEKNPLIKKINFHGITLLTKREEDSLFQTLLNEPFNSKKIYSRLTKLLNVYRDLGYSLADLDKYTFNPEDGALNLFFDEGKISRIIIKGNDYTRSSVILREFPLKKGDYFTYDQVSQGLTNLRSTNLFNDIILTFKRENNKDVLFLNVVEKVSSLIRFGFRVDNEDKAQLSLDVRDDNLYGTGTELGLLLYGGTRNRAYILEHKSNRIFNTYFTYKINAFYQFDDAFSYTDSAITKRRFISPTTGEYRQIYYGTSLAFGTQVERFGNLIFKGTYKFDQVKIKQGKTGFDAYKLRLVTLKASSTIDTQDKYPFPEKGIFFSGFYETAQTALGSDVGYFNVGFNYKSYFTFGKVHTFSPRLRMGFADKTLPISEQYSLGGEDMFYGFRKDQYRGRQIFVGSLAYRYKLPFEIFFDTYLGLRYDLGSIWPGLKEIKFKDFKHGIGTSVSFDTPIGPAEFAVGESFIPGNPVKWGDTQFYFSIGYYY
jgi:NTE family protein